MKRLLLFLSPFLLLGSVCAQSVLDTSKPWTYWWWMGSAVNEADLRWQLEGFAEAGLGGVHIIPIYGVKGEEESFLPFMEEAWMKQVQLTEQICTELGLGMDLTMGTGWPFGGPWIGKEAAAKQLVHGTLPDPIKGNQKIAIDSFLQTHRLEELYLLEAQEENGHRQNWKGEALAANQELNLPEGNWRLSWYGMRPTGQQVKRAAPGAMGPVLDYFDQQGIAAHLAFVDSILANTEYRIAPRVWYHDSYETYGANWTTTFAGNFEKKFGYDPVEKLWLLEQENHPDRPAFLRDWRAALADLLHQEFSQPWTNWTREQKAMTRYQAHGSPGNILDLYALSDIPETESFGCSSFPIPGLNWDPDYEEDRFGRPSPLMMKFASSPAHLLQKPLVSAETATWLGNHFKVSLAQVKPHIDQLFVAGINHVFYHGSTYTPQSEGFPGWLFYASTNFGPQSHFREEFPLLNEYVARCQSRLQAATPDNDILLYFPIDDLWASYPGDPLLLLDVHKYQRWFSQTPFGQTAQALWEAGYTFDFISDQQLLQLAVKEHGQLAIGDGPEYQVVMLPPTQALPMASLQHLNQLAENGGNVLLANHLPKHAPKSLAPVQEKPRWKSLQQSFSKQAGVVVSEKWEEELPRLGARKEILKPAGLDFIRKKDAEGIFYFVSNLGNQFEAGEISLSVQHAFVETFDPMTGVSGYVEGGESFWLELKPGESRFLRPIQSQPDLTVWSATSGSQVQNLEGEWQAEVMGEIEGEHEFAFTSLASWTEWGSPGLEAYCGKVRYQISFDVPKSARKARKLSLHLEQVHETASIRLNGQECGTIWAYPLEMVLPVELLKKKGNTLEITVQNLSANRIRAIDREGIDWKKFYDINLVDIQYHPFDASEWELMPSGLVGKVWLEWE